MYNTKQKGAIGKNSWLFLLEIIKNCILNEKFNPYMTTIRALFSKLGHFCPIFQQKQGPLPCPSNYVPASTAWIYLCQQQEDRKRCEVYSKLTIKTLEEQRYCWHPGVFIADLRTNYTFLLVFANYYILL